MDKFQLLVLHICQFLLKKFLYYGIYEIVSLKNIVKISALIIFLKVTKFFKI